MYYAPVLDGVRVLAGYAVLVPVALGTLVGTLLLTNILASYWFQQRRDHRRHAPARGLPLDPPVARISRLRLSAHTEPAAHSVELAGSPETSRELNLLATLVVRDFVHQWFGDVTADTAFPRAVHAQLAQLVDVVAERADQVDLAAFVVGQVLPLATAHIHAAKDSEPGKPHPALQADAGGVRAYVRRVVDLVVPLVLPDHSEFAPHRVLVRELLAMVLAPAVQALADPDTVNQLVDTRLERLIREQHMVTELRDALEKQAVAEPTVRTYEEFIALIDGCTDARELEMIGDDILAQIRKHRILIMGQAKDDIVHGARVRDILVYINRLYVAKKKAERRLELLRADSAACVRNLRASYYEHRDDPRTLGPPQFTLREILTNVASLSAFAEYMDLIGDRFALEFWVNIEGVRHADAAVLPQVVASLWKTYFTRRVDELASPVGGEVEAAISHVQRCLKPHRIAGTLDLEGLAPDVCSEAMRLIFLVQDAVFRRIEVGAFGTFLRSTIYSRFLREYYVTPRREQLSAALFGQRDAQEGARRRRGISIPSIPSIRALAKPLQKRPDSQRSVSGGSASTAPAALDGEKGEGEGASRWGFALARQPTVATDTAEASRDHVTVLRASPPASLRSGRAVRRRSVRVDQAEVRRLSASLRSIGLGDASEPEYDQLAQVAENTEDVEDAEDAEDAGPDRLAQLAEDSDSQLDALSADEAESLVLARVVKTPTPGDLFLKERLEQLARDLERKAHQMAIVRVLMRQAGGRPEQRVLRASYHGLRREVHVGAEQQRHYEAALDDHFLAPSRTRVHIPRAVTGEHPEPHTVYLIELQQTLDSTAATGWVVERRYREFFSLHRDLRSMYPAEMRRHDLPSRTPLVRLQRDRDIEHRRAGLEKYLQGLLREPRLCASRPLRVFLSSTDEPDQADPEAAGWMAQIYKTVGEDLEGITGADSMLEIIVQELGSQVALQQPRTESPVESTVFVDPLSDLFIEVFGLRNRRNWLRRQAISILLRHIVGGTVERRVRDVLTVDDARIAGLLSGLRQTLWPLDGKSQHYLKFQGFKARTTEEKNECKERAKRQVLWFLPRVLSGMVGRKNARDGAALLVDSVQNQMANLSLALHIFDAVIVAVFPEVKYQLEHLLES